MSKPKKCVFYKNGHCFALACYSDEKCGARDERGNPKYVDLKNKKKTPKMKTDRIKIKLRKKDKLYLIGSSEDTVTYLHNWIKTCDKIVIEVERER